MAEEESENKVTEDLSKFVDDKHEEVKTLVLGAFITDESGEKLQADYDTGVTLSIEIEEQVREVGTWPASAKDFPGLDKNRFPERRYKIKDGEDKERVEDLLYWDTKYKRDKIVYTIANIEASKYNLKQDIEGIYPLDEKAVASIVNDIWIVNHPKEDSEDKGYFTEFYKTLTGQLNWYYIKNTTGDVTIQRSPPASPVTIKGGLPDELKKGNWVVATLGPITGTGSNQTRTRSTVTIQKKGNSLLPKTSGSNKLPKKFEIEENPIAYNNRPRSTANDKFDKDNKNVFMRYEFEEVNVALNTVTDPITEKSIEEQLKEKGKTDEQITTIMNSIKILVLQTPAMGLNNPAVIALCKQHDVTIPLTRLVPAYNPIPDPKVHMTFLHIVDGFDIGDALFIDKSIDTGTIDNCKKLSSFLEMEADKVLALKYVDRNHVGMNKMLMSLINDDALKSMEQIKGLKINNFKGQPSDPNMFVLDGSTVQFLAKRFDKIEISNSLVRLKFPESGSIDVGSLTLEHCTLIGGNSTINVVGDLKMVSCTTESVNTDKRRNLIFNVKGNADISELKIGQNLAVLFHGKSDESTMSLKNTELQTTTGQSVALTDLDSSLYVAGFSDLSVVGLKRKDKMVSRAPMIEVTGCDVISMMDIDNGIRDFSTLIIVNGFNDLMVSGVKATTADKQNAFKSVVKISNSSDEAKIKLSDIEVKGLGYIYEIIGCKLFSFKLDSIKSSVGSFEKLFFNNAVETVSISDCDIHFDNSVNLEYACEKLTFSSSRIFAPSVNIKVFKAVHLDNSTLVSEKDINVELFEDSRFSMMSSTLEAKNIKIFRGFTGNEPSVEFTDSAIDATSTLITEINKVVMELCVIMSQRLTIKKCATVDINDNIVRVNKTGLILFEQIEEIKYAEYKLDNGGDLTVTTVDSNGTLAFEPISKVRLKRESSNSITVDEHTIEDQDEYKVTIVSNKCNSSAHIIDKKYLSISLNGTDFRLFKPIDTVEMYSKTKSLRGGYDKIYYGIPAPKE